MDDLGVPLNLEKHRMIQQIQPLATKMVKNGDLTIWPSKHRGSNNTHGNHMAIEVYISAVTNHKTEIWS